MNNIWVLTVRTSLPRTCCSASELKTTMTAFDSFDKARDALRAKLKELTFSDNAMFDGNGGIRMLDRYIKDTDDDYDDEGCLSHRRLQLIRTALRQCFAGKDTVVPLDADTYTDWMIAVEVSGNAIRFFGDDDGPCNGYDPVLATNMFSMEAGQAYYLYIDDCFGQDSATAELYIDLQPVDVL